MKNSRTDHVKHRLGKYIEIILIVLIIFVVMNKFGFNKATEVSQTGGGGLYDMALGYYFEKYPEQVNSKDIEVDIQNFGCHQEIFIYKDGNKVMKMIYEYGQLQELK